MNSIAFIILNYNDVDTTIKLVDGLCGYSGNQFNYRVIVVDNCSTDSSMTVLRERYADKSLVDVIASQRNGGYSYGNNLGARYAIENYDPDYLAVANPDIWVDEETVAGLLETFKEDDKLCMCSPVMKDLSGGYHIHSQELPTFKDDLTACFSEKKPRTIKVDNYDYLNENHNMILTEMLPGSFFIVRAELFQKIGMLDENVFLFCEERILGKRMKDNGYKAVLRSDLFFLHAHSTSIGKAYKIIQTRRLILKSRIYYEEKYNHINIMQGLLLRSMSALSLFYLDLKLKIRGLIKG